MTLKRLTIGLSLLCASLLTSACASVELPDIKAYVTLPASEDGYGVSTLSRKEVRIPKAEWEQKRKRGIILFSEDWEKLKFTLIKNCVALQCKQTVGALDGLFYSIDDALKKLPGVK